MTTTTSAATITPPQTPPPWPVTTPNVTVGSIQRIDAFPSKFIDPRPVDVWLPAGYSPARRYAVLYMQDGQMLFDADKTWNKSAWNVHEALSKLIQAGKVRDTIVVGIPNNGKYRYSEYYPEKMLAMAPQARSDDYRRRAQWGFALADAYLKFVVEELKPTIDEHFHTAGAARLERATRVVQPHVAAVVHHARDGHVVVGDEHEPVVHVELPSEDLDVADHVLAGLVLRMGLAGEHELRRLVGRQEHLAQTIGLRQQQRGPLVGGETAGEADGERLRVEQGVATTRPDERDQFGTRLRPCGPHLGGIDVIDPDP